MQQTVNNSVGKEMTVNGDNEIVMAMAGTSRALLICKNAIGDYMAACSNGPIEAFNSDASAAYANSKFSTDTLLPAAYGLDMGTFKSFNCQLPK
ncbi:unnamed protein product [Lupinus luteus]|uniref:Uncharacterized protein n=1 Tax=Lupinus luteus TaxID=3873 RepID=A0AAV1XZ52_LUPLU